MQAVYITKEANMLHLILGSNELVLANNGLAVPTLSDKKNNGFVGNIMKQSSYKRRLKMNWDMKL